METSRETMQEDSVTVEETMTPREATEVITGFEFEVDRSRWTRSRPRAQSVAQSTNDVWPRLSSLISPFLLEFPSTGADRSAPVG